MARRRRISIGEPVSALTTQGNENVDLIALWCLRVVLSLERAEDLIGNALPDQLLQVAGLLFDADEDADAHQTWRRLRIRLAELEASPPRLAGVLGRNLVHAQAALALSADDVALLGFAALLYSDGTLDDTADLLGHRLSNAETVRALDQILRLPAGTAQRVLRPSETLAACGLLRLDPDPNRLQSKLELLAGFASALTSEHGCPAALRPQDPVRPSAPRAGMDPVSRGPEGPGYRGT